MKTKNVVLYRETKHAKGEDGVVFCEVTVTATTNPADTAANAYLLFMRAWDVADHGCRETILLNNCTTNAQAIREGIAFLDGLKIPEDLVLQ